MICAGKKITKNIGFNCAIVGGVEAAMYIFNRTEIEAIVRDSTNPMIVEDLTMKVKTPGATPVLFTGFKYEGYNNSVLPQATFVAGRAVGPRYDHIIDFTIFARGADVKSEIEALGADRKVVVIENVNKEGDSAFEIYGLEVGLELKSLTYAPGGESEGAYVLQMGSPEQYKEPHLPASFYAGTYADTVDALNDLISTDAAI